MITQVHTRSRGSVVLGVDWPNRTITVIAAPYNQYAEVVFQGQVWREIFLPGAFGGIDTDPEHVRVNREHNKSDAVGKVVGFDTADPRGLIADISIAPTQRGDDTLVLASERALSASVGFGVHPGGQILDRGSRTRRVTRAWLDHVALVQSPAYDSAAILAVRATPALDAALADPVLHWAHQRALLADPIFRWARDRLRR